MTCIGMQLPHLQQGNSQGTFPSFVQSEIEHLEQLDEQREKRKAAKQVSSIVCVRACVRLSPPLPSLSPCARTLSLAINCSF